ncbi:MAG: hypothetical protein KatS3mg118_3617 [Paracoccaceae bacterium]|nr:MAG: hypothetical protein KatS3mg118_3617 [Paracoccaceae bacterium]
MATEYGRAGVLGMLTPQANTTVEPEFRALLPPDWAMINARLTSARGSIEERLVDYADRFAETCGQFANAPLSAIAIGCTGASYLIGREAEARILAGIEARHGVPVYSAATAVVAAMRALAARRIGLVSPYPEGLDAACAAYWEGHGLTVTAKAAVGAETAAFHPIYAMAGAACLDALRSLQGGDCEAVILLGTGMPTLAPLLAVAGRGGPPAISCNLALAWAACDGARAETLPAWIAGAGWGDRLARLYPAALGAET